MKMILTGVLVVILLSVGLIAIAVLKGNGKRSEAVHDKDSAPSGPPADLIRPPSDPNAGNIDLKFIVLGDRQIVFQGAETDIEMRVVRHGEYSVASSSLGNVAGPVSLLFSGKFQGDTKLSSEIVKGGKGLTIAFDPETVKGSDDKSKLRIKADADADLGDVEVEVTATTPDGEAESAKVTLEVYKK